MEMITLTVANHSYRLPKEPICDSADLDYIADVENTLKYRSAGLLTNRETLEQLLLAHATWCSI